MDKSPKEKATAAKPFGNSPIEKKCLMKFKTIENGSIELLSELSLTVDMDLDITALWDPRNRMNENNRVIKGKMNLLLFLGS